MKITTNRITIRKKTKVGLQCAVTCFLTAVVNVLEKFGLLVLEFLYYYLLTLTASVNKFICISTLT